MRMYSFPAPITCTSAFALLLASPVDAADRFAYGTVSSCNFTLVVQTLLGQFILTWARMFLFVLKSQSNVLVLQLRASRWAIYCAGSSCCSCTGGAKRV